MKLLIEYVIDLGIMRKLFFVSVYIKFCKLFLYKVINLVCMVVFYGVVLYNGCRIII